MEQHPALAKVSARRLANWQLRLADKITTFAGSMRFVWIHAAIFLFWCSTGLFGADRFPFNFLTMTVSLEAIFLSTFVMIGQNRQAQFQQAKADHDFVEEELLLKENTELTRQIHNLTTQIDRALNPPAAPKRARKKTTTTE